MNYFKVRGNLLQVTIMTTWLRLWFEHFFFYFWLEMGNEPQSPVLMSDVLCVYQWATSRSEK